jgi:hypothetical protein
MAVLTAAIDTMVSVPTAAVKLQLVFPGFFDDLPISLFKNHPLFLLCFVETF